MYRKLPKPEKTKKTTSETDVNIKEIYRKLNELKRNLKITMYQIKDLLVLVYI